MDIDNYERHSRPQRRQRTKWNYQRIAVALLALAFIGTIAIYGGYTLAHKLTGQRAQSITKGNDKVRVASEVVKPTILSTTTTTAQHIIHYTVKEGDTLYGIAIEHKTTVAKIKELNKIPDENNDLHIGMILKIPSTAPVSETTSTPGNSEDNSADSAIKPSRQEISKGPQDKKRVALTFDLGSNNEATSKILRELKDERVRATFFLTGKWVEENRGLAKQIIDSGNLIGNHSYSHPDLTKETESNIVYQLNAADGVIKSVTGRSSKPLFRPPYGARDARVLRIAAEEGYRSIFWTIDSLDWKPGMKPDQIKNRILAGIGNGSIVLMNCGSLQTSEMLTELIAELKNRGYQIVTVPQLFE